MSWCVLPVELVDVLDVAEQHADLLWTQRQGAAVDDAAEIILQTQTKEPDEIWLLTWFESVFDGDGWHRDMLVYCLH